MRLYNSQQQFYCGIDLHANAMYACVVDAAGKKCLHENFHRQLDVRSGRKHRPDCAEFEDREPCRLPLDANQRIRAHYAAVHRYAPPYAAACEAQSHHPLAMLG